MNSPVLSADILGQVYEQFLGKVIRLTAGHQAKVEDKPEVRKAGGVYYTPTYIVDYIVHQTVGQLLAGKKPGPRSPGKLTILDPACGSGSFLLGAYQFLLDWHLDSYCAGPGQMGQGHDTPSLPGRQGRLETDHRRAQTHPAGPYLRRGHRLAGRGSDQALAAAQGPGRRERAVGEAS